MPGSTSHHRRGDAAAAVALAALLSAAWAWVDRANLLALRLPDTDDAMRLQQVRDWLGGQRFADLTQHRLGDGLAMHWSRLGDLLPAGLIAALTPLIGRHAAEVAAVVATPALLFAAALFLVTRIARAVGSEPRTAAVIAAIGYPATTLFLPGRIDHHGLQMVLLLSVVLALLGRGTWGKGLAAGLAIAASLAIGLETAPVLAVASGAALVAWLSGHDGAEARLAGLGLGAAAGLAAAALVLRPVAWRYPACDGFTAEAWRAAQLLAMAPLVLALVGRWVRGPSGRAALAIGIGGAGAITALWLSPGCLHPYGRVDPVLARLWLDRVGEAQPLLAAPAADAIGYAGLLVAGILAGAWQLWRQRTGGWALLLALQFASLGVALIQLRGAYPGALLAAPALASLVAAARTRGAMRLAGAWAASAGLLYPLAAQALIAPKPEPGGGSACAIPAALDALAALPPARVLAPVDLGAFLVAGTGHRAVAAPYHRNDAGNRAVFAFYARSELQARAVAQRWRVELVLACPEAARPGSMAARLTTGHPPRWLRPGATLPGGLRVFAVEPGLSASAPTH